MEESKLETVKSLILGFVIGLAAGLLLAAFIAARL